MKKNPSPFDETKFVPWARRPLSGAFALSSPAVAESLLLHLPLRGVMMLCGAVDMLLLRIEREYIFVGSTHKSEILCRSNNNVFDLRSSFWHTLS